MLIRRVLWHIYTFFHFPLELLRYSSSKVDKNTGKKKECYSQQKCFTVWDIDHIREATVMAEEGVQTGRLMGPSERGSEVLKVSRDGLQGGFRAAFNIDVLKRWQEEAELSLHDSAIRVTRYQWEPLIWSEEQFMSSGLNGCFQNKSLKIL